MPFSLAVLLTSLSIDSFFQVFLSYLCSSFIFLSFRSIAPLIYLLSSLITFSFGISSLFLLCFIAHSVLTLEKLKFRAPRWAPRWASATVGVAFGYFSSIYPKSIGRF